MRLPIIIAGLMTVFSTSMAVAEGVSIDPGQWEMTSTITMSMMPTPQTTSTSECIREPELNPDDFNMDENNPCDISQVQINGNSARWSISCPSEGGPVMEGTWEFTSTGDEISGSGSMSADYAGQEMSFSMTWEGKRVGDCE